MKRTIAEIGQLYDGPHATPTRRTEGPYFLNIASLQSGRLDLSISDHVSEEDFTRWTRRVQPEAGDLLFSYETRLGEAAIMPANVRACLGRRMALLRPNRDLIDPRYLLYYYLGPQFQTLVERNTQHGATVNRISLSTMGSWVVDIPVLRDQKVVAGVLGSLDDKIAANSRVVDSADALARAIANLAVNRGAKEPLSAAAAVTMGSSPDGETFNDNGVGIPFFQGTRDFGVRFPKRRVWTTGPIRMAIASDCLFSVRAPVGAINIAREELCIGRGLASVRTKRDLPYSLFHILSLSSDSWTGYQSEGTVFGSINRQQLSSLPIFTVSESVSVRLEAQLAALELRIRSALDENDALAGLRDELLPHLISGRLRIRDAEKQVEDVV